MPLVSGRMFECELCMHKQFVEKDKDPDAWWVFRPTTLELTVCNRCVCMVTFTHLQTISENQLVPNVAGPGLEALLSYTERGMNEKRVNSK